jgi:hypothetical protein
MYFAVVTRLGGVLTFSPASPSSFALSLSPSSPSLGGKSPWCLAGSVPSDVTRENTGKKNGIRKQVKLLCVEEEKTGRGSLGR